MSFSDNSEDERDWYGFDSDQDDSPDGDRHGDVPQFRPEFNATERTGLPGGMLNTFLTGKTNFGDFQKGVNNHVRDPVARFAIFIDAISRGLMSDSSFLSDEDIETMLGSISNLEYPEYKNATAFVLGYIITNGRGNAVGNNINADKVNTVFSSILPHLRDTSVKPEDIIRYGRLWLSIQV